MGRGRAPCCQKVGLNRGSWTPEEDMRLVAYIHKHGHGNWRALPKQAGLLRCGKSCRLRWINYLRPDIKRGNFTGEEEETIIKLHGLLGNKWSKIASCLPGRTDNEIKNVWNTHLKKRVAGKEKKRPPPPPEEEETDQPSSPSDSCSSDQDKTAVVVLDVPEHSRDANVGQEEKIEISVIEPSMDVLRMLEDSLSKAADVEPPPKVSPSSSSSSSSSSITTCRGDGLDDLLGEIPDIPMEPELWSAIDDVIGGPEVVVEEAAAGGSGEGESRRWLADLEKELDLWGGGNEVGHHQTVGSWADQMEGEDDPVTCYFQPSSSSSFLN